MAFWSIFFFCKKEGKKVVLYIFPTLTTTPRVNGQTKKPWRIFLAENFIHTVE